jgi:FKBP-type peptidyl-prolyl cis-trans isomerase FkpA
MKQIFNVAVICVLALAACTTPFKKTKDGSEYKVISIKKGAKILTGNFMEMNVSAKYKDSVLFNSATEGIPQFGMYDTASFPMPFKEAFKNVHVGDSIVIRIPTDSIMKKGQAAPFMQKGQFIYQNYVITNVYKTKEEVDSVQKIFAAAAQKRDSIAAIAQTAKDSKTIEEYLAKNKITAVKAEKGTFVQILDPGTGPAADTSMVMMVNYTGRTFDGVRFDSNTDSLAQMKEPYPVNLKAPQVVQGWVDGLKLLKKGAKATFFIPSSLGYGKYGNGEKIKPNDNLIFDIQVADVITQAQFEELMKKKQQEQMQQQQMMEQIQKQMQQQQQQNPPKGK